MMDDTNETTQTLRLDLTFTPKVLIVDDDPQVLARLRDIVESDGYLVHTAANGVDALAALDQHASSIVVTDLNMPKMNGLDLCRQIRQRASLGYVYVVLLTIRDEEKDLLAGFDAGADDYLSKRSSTALFKARLKTAKRVIALESSLKDALDKKRHLAMSDSLTGVFNRRYFVRHLSRALKRVQRFGGNVSLLVLDVDHFKRINDGFGHVSGDLVLRMLTRQIGQCLKRETDWCARIGGDEFIVVLEGAKLAEARTCAEKVREAVASATIDTPLGCLRFTVSIGVSGSEDLPATSPLTVQSLLERADAQMYASKAEGRNRVSASNCVELVTRKTGTPRTTHANPKAPLSSVR